MSVCFQKLSTYQKKISIHEAGHYLVAYLLYQLNCKYPYPISYRIKFKNSETLDGNVLVNFTNKHLDIFNFQINKTEHLSNALVIGAILIHLAGSSTHFVLFEEEDAQYPLNLFKKSFITWPEDFKYLSPFLMNIVNDHSRRFEIIIAINTVIVQFYSQESVLCTLKTIACHMIEKTRGFRDKELDQKIRVNPEFNQWKNDLKERIAELNTLIIDINKT